MGAYSNATSWWLGDWLLFGQMKYGRRYKQAILATGLDYQTLRNYAAVARRFEVTRRRGNLSFQHHAEVCALPGAEQDHWLDLASGNGWSRNELRRNVRASLAGADSPCASRVLRLAIEPHRLHHWHEAARHGGCNFQAWIARALDDAAAAELGADP